MSDTFDHFGDAFEDFSEQNEESDNADYGCQPLEKPTQDDYPF